MSKTDTTKIIEACLFQLFFLEKSMRCGLEVETFNDRNYWNKRVDFIAYDKKEVFTFIEIKISVADFKSKHGHSFNGHKNYYAMPLDVYEKVKDLIPKEIGVYVLSTCNEYDKNKKECYIRHCLILEKRCSTIKNCKLDSGNRMKEQKWNVLTACNSTIRRLISPIRDIRVAEDWSDK